jgi:hypothetical protein
MSSPQPAINRFQNLIMLFCYRVRATGSLTKEERGRRIISPKKRKK